MEYACEAGVTPQQFWLLTWRELEMLCNGYEKRLARGKEIQRMILAGYLNAHRKPGSPPVNIEKMVPLITDRRQRKVDLMTAEEYEERLKLGSRVTWQAPFKN